MKTAALLALAVIAATPAAFAQSPAEAMKGKMKPGLYAYKMEMDMGQVPGAPAGTGKQTLNMQQCVTDKDIEGGQLGKGGDMPKNCQMKDFKMTGNTASYKMACKGEFEMNADTDITFVPDGFRMNMKMQMAQGGQKMNMTQKMEGKYLGACPKK